MAKKKKKRSRRKTNRPAPNAVRLSACLIVKDEADCLGTCLESIQDLADEIVVVDTGSTDDTVAIARRFGARVRTAKWRDDFSAARNVSVSHARGEWILVLDADEAIAKQDHDRIRSLLDAVPLVMGFTLVQRNYCDAIGAANWQAAAKDCAEARGAAGWVPSPIVRLFRRNDQIRFSGEVHESVDASIAALGGSVDDTSVPIHHYGKLRDSDRLKTKAALYQKLGQQKSAREDSVRAHYEIGLQNAELGLFSEAEAEFRSALSRDETYAKAWSDLGAVLERQGRDDDALAAYRQAHEADPTDVPALVNLGVALSRAGESAPARQMFEQALARNPRNHIVLNNFAAHCVRVGDHDSAIAFYRDSCVVNPRYAATPIYFAKLLIRLKRYAEACEVLEASAEQFPDHAAVHETLALAYIQQRGWHRAIEAAERAISLNNQSVVAWTNLGLAKYQTEDIEGGMSATYHAIGVDPSYAAAKRNWEQLSAAFPEQAERVQHAASVDPDLRPVSMRVAFVHSGQAFTGLTISERGLGGTETAVIRAAEALVRQGCSVDVYTGCERDVAVNGVNYYPAQTSAATWQRQPPNVVIAVRNWRALEMANPAVTERILWAHDAPDQPSAQALAHQRAQECIDRYLGVSDWQIQAYHDEFDLARERWIRTRNGADFGFFQPDPMPERDRKKLIYTSTPFRGLDVLLELFPRIREAVPDVTLDVYGDMSLYDTNVTGVHGTHVVGTQPGVTFKGSVPQAELAQALLSAGILAYPNHFPETSCIAAIEAQAAGCPVVTSALGALPETVRDGETGICIPGDPKSRDFQGAFVEAVVELLRNDSEWRRISVAARERARREYSWDVIVGDWLESFAGAAV